ncbi:MAG: hypothetical protein Q8K78_17820 [Planctomycetaceae bacterium]|nr:hypothetical protein [Planctomycetaceae bacterium]
MAKFLGYLGLGMGSSKSNRNDNASDTAVLQDRQDIERFDSESPRRLNYACWGDE